MPKDVLITPASGLVDFKDTSGNVDAYIQLDDTGNLNINNAGGNLIVGNTSSNVYIGNGVVSTDVIFEQNGAIRALAGKTLTLGQSDSNITIAAADTTVNGNLLVSNLEPNLKMNFVGQTTTAVGLRVLADGAVSFEGSSGQLFSISNSMSGTIFSVNDISGIPSIEVLDTGLIKLNQYNGQTVIGGATAAGTAELTVYPSAAANIGLVVKGFSSQTAKLQEWQNSAGTTLNAIGTNGEMQGTYFGSLAGSKAYIQTDYDTNAIGVFSGAAANKGLVVRGAASQSANLQEWQNSAGTVLARINSSGQITASNIKMPNSFSIGLGTSALNAVTSGDYNVAIGYNALLVNTNGSSNIAIGSNALDQNTTGGDNIAIGYEALSKNVIGYYNIGIGTTALFNTTGENNTSVGAESMYSNTSGNDNTAVGYYALGANTTGINNVAIGGNAGDNITTGSNNIVIGRGADASSASVSNEITMGNTSITRFRIPGIGIDFNKNIEIMNIMGAY